MAVRFAHGTSTHSTKTISQAGKVAPPQSNTMKGMPGTINTAARRDSSDVLTGKGVGPKREGPVGSKGGAHRANQQNGRGSTDKSYKATSTGHPGRIEKLAGKARMSSEK